MMRNVVCTIRSDTLKNLNRNMSRGAKGHTIITTIRIPSTFLRRCSSGLVTDGLRGGATISEHTKVLFSSLAMVGH